MNRGPNRAEDGPDKAERAKPLRIFLIRHGRTALEGRYKGQLDPPLSPGGIKDVEGSALVLEKILENGSLRLNAIYASDLSRALQSADVIAKALKVKKVVPMGLLRERAFGKWEGMRYDEIEKLYPREFGLWVKDPFANRPVGGESSLAVKKRALASIKEITGRSRPGDTLAIVSHSGILRVLLCHFLGMPYKNIFRADVGFGGVSLVELFDFDFDFDGKAGSPPSPIIRFMNLMPDLALKSKPSPSASLLPLPTGRAGERGRREAARWSAMTMRDRSRK